MRSGSLACFSASTTMPTRRPWKRWIAPGAPLAIVRPDDYTLVVSRAAIIPKIARRPDLAGLFLDYVLSVHGQTLLRDKTGMLSTRRGLDMKHAVPNARPVELGVGLLVYLDELKKSHFLRTWDSALFAEEAPQCSNRLP